jgi:hypothetical protein
MKRVLGLGLALALAGGGARVARATEATCVVGSATSINNLDLPFAIPVATGIAMPVEFDEQHGTFSMKRDAWSTAFGASGAEFETGFGPQGFLIMSPGTVTGTIDAAGTVTLPGFAMAFATNFCPPRSPDYPIVADLSTGTQLRFATGQVFQLQGVPLDFASGTLTIEGEDVIPSACGAPGAILSGLRLTCTLSPVPDKSKLPPPLALTKLAGKGKIGKPLPSTPPTKPDKGDVLSLGARLVNAAAPLDVAGHDVFLVISAGATDVVVVRVPAGSFKSSGKRATAGGSAIQLVKGHKTSGAVAAAPGGTITFVTGKKGTDVKAKVQGLDLSAVSGSATFTLAVGPWSAAATGTVRGNGKKLRFH